ncbi:methionine--tRNA ligase [Candidatus Dojkabacteria bacterium]|uniref:methionine--tRNA ligase n=1 Tax=Candidatus Dojkabacteria bacterium TaxID=2099670 RepID=A0A847VDF6_9BACT|nr:methionine--tRNA ligase [Candidatus Dojkabacteria bacterium]
MDRKKLFITTTLPYVNAEPHIGHALEFVQADTIARYFREKLGKENVFFNIGTDEHGLKVYTTAQRENMDIRAFVDKYSQRFRDFCKLFFVEYDYFYRTSSTDHHKAAQEFWKRCEAKGDIYKKKYSGLYCLGCERFITEKELVDGKCPDHGIVPELKEEENYFFRLSKYREHLLDWINSNPGVLKPKQKLEELRAIIKDIEDVSISRQRKNLPWGIEVPNDPEQVLYVWFDALTNYVNVVGFGSDEKKLKEWWPGIQLFGPDNLRFQAVIWQGMLISAGLEHTLRLLEHGMVLSSDGTKMSKTKGNVISPFEQEKKYSAEIVRFYLLTGILTYADSAYKEDDLVNMYNSRLVNNFGNLLHRVLHLSNRYSVEINNESTVEEDFKQSVSKYVREIEGYYNDYEIAYAGESIDRLADWGNKYITEREPWGSKVSAKERENILNNLSYLLQLVIHFYTPIIPSSSELAKKALYDRENIILFKKI